MSARGFAVTPWRGVGILISLSAWFALFGALGFLPQACLRFVAAPVVLIGFALPLLALRSPRESSWVKLWVLATFASPPLGALVFGLARLGLPADPALALTFALPALALPLLGKRLDGPEARFERPGRALWVAAGLGLGLAVFVAWRTGTGLAALGYERVAIVQAAQRSFPPTNPFLAGAPWQHAWFSEHLLAYVGRALALEPGAAFTVTIVAFASVVPLALALTFAPLAGNGRVELAAVLGALLGVAAFGLAEPMSGLGAALTGDCATALALSWSTAAGLASAHALRHGRAPWVELCGLFLAFAFLAAPHLGAVAVAAVGLAALICPARPEVRPRLLLALALATLPAVIAARALGLAEPLALAGAEATVHPAFPSALALLAALAAAFVTRASARDGTRAETRVIAAWLGLLAICACLGTALFGWTPALGGSAAGGLLGAGLALWARRSRAAAFAAAALGAGLVFTGGAALERSRADRVGGSRTHDVALALATTEQSSATERDVARALVWLAEELPFRELDPILVVHPGRPLAVDDPDRFGENAAAAVAALVDLDLWCTPGPRGFGERQSVRVEGLTELYETKDKFDRELLRELVQLERPAIVLVTRKDRWRFPWLENKFGPSGFGILKIVDSVGLFVWPAELATNVPAQERAFPEHHFPRGPSVLGREEER